jgi:protein-tyrosine phosphatase
MKESRRWAPVLVAVALVALLLPLAGGCGTATSPAVKSPSSVHWVELDGVSNARDLGGWTLQDGSKIPYGRVFRSGKLSEATPEDLAKIKSLGIHTSIDLRSQPEVKVGGQDPVGAQGLSSTVSAPMLIVPSAVGYRNLVADQKPAIATAFKALADPADYPVIIHCSAGKDRTGIVSALLLELLGVPRKQVVSEYMLSASSGAVNEKWINAALDEVDAQGGIQKYMTGIGISPSMQAAIKKNVLGK